MLCCCCRCEFLGHDIAVVQEDPQLIWACRIGLDCKLNFDRWRSMELCCLKVTRVRRIWQESPAKKSKMKVLLAISKRFLEDVHVMIYIENVVLLYDKSNSVIYLYGIYEARYSQFNVL